MPAEYSDDPLNVATPGDQDYRTLRFPRHFGNIDVTINDHAIVASH